MISSRYMNDSSSSIKSIFTRQYDLSIVVAPAPDYHGHGTGFVFTQPRNESGEGRSYFVSTDVLTLGAVGNFDDESIFSISSFFSKLREIP